MPSGFECIRILTKMKIKKTIENHFGLTYIATGKETNGKYFLSETVIPVGDSGPPPHIHANEDEGFFVQEGELTLIVNDNEVKLKSGEFLNVEKGEKHTWRNDADSDARLIITFSPAGIENMFIELENDMQNIVEIGKRYGTEFEVG